jgi:hypothetical protein
MSSRSLFRVALVALAATATGAMALPEDRTPGESRDALGMHMGAARLTSAGPMTFNQDAILFLADSRAATLWAVDVGETGTAKFGERDLVPDLDLKVAGLLGTTRDKIRFGDMARHPKTGSLYFTVSRVTDGPHESALVRARGADQVELVNLDNIRNSSAPLPEAPAKDAKTPWGQPQWMLAVTDLAYVDGELWIAGLSNEQFASALRRLPFPFGKSGALTTVEIFHTSHDRWETAAPIDAFLPITLNGTPSLLAGYGCSPIATFTQADLKKGGHLRGRTVAELGGGSRPIDMIRYQREGKEWVLIANSARTLMRLDPDEIARAPELTKAVAHAFEPAGVGYLPVASAGVMRIADFGPELVAVLMRDIDTGAVKVTSYQKKWL